VIERNDAGPEFGHPPGETARTAGDIQNDISAGDRKESFGGRLNQQGLKVIPVAYSVVPPEGVRIPYPAILIRVLGELGFPSVSCHL